MATSVESLDTIAGLEIAKAADSDGYIKLMVYGNPGAGKTWLVTSAADVPEMNPILFIDMEGGLLSAGRKYPNLHVIRIKDTHDAKGNVTMTAWEHLYQLYEALKTKPHPYKTIILDSATEAYALCMRWVMENMVKKAKERGKDRDPDIPDKKEYAKARSRVHMMLRAFRDLEAHVLMTALKDVKTEQETGRVINYIPALPGKLAYEVAQFMDELVYLYIEQSKDATKRRLLTQEINKYLAKDRSDALSQTVENPSMPTLVPLLTGKEAPNREPATVTK